jgi:cyclohexa-1,5-dienecarbonyl-CoA hydratase
MEKIKVNFLHSGSVAQVILDDGKGNVLDHLMMEELMAAFETFRHMNDLKLITFEGAGKHFSFGASVEEHQKDLAGAMLKSFHHLFFTLKDMAIPTLAKISGQCLGGGMELAIMCNFMFADSSAKLSQPEIVLGVFPPPASIILAEKVGLAKAEELILTGMTITAEHGKTMGLIIDVFESKVALESGVDGFIEQYILPKSASSLRFAVKACRVKFNHVLTNYLPTLEQLYVNELMNTKDANEGIGSFIEKRKPVWQNN